ncbi:leucine-rich repeat domain-containing protein [Tenacibaculum sp. TC6]|uniref:leucine-rich repeat domain-containing protein n=1 Tax=Tenacibaculum sp. TC6 TaxID=3423223 RepID=UPI003D362802
MNTKLLIFLFFLVSCSTVKKSNKSDLFSQEEKTKDSLILSSRNLKNIPDLSEYKARYLDLSNNAIDHLDEAKMPKNLLELNLSNNKLSGDIKIFELNKLEKLNISSNKIRRVFLKYCIKNINLSSNNLIDILTNCVEDRPNMMDTLNISNNNELSNILRFSPSVYKKIYRKEIKNDLPLVWSFEVPIKN